MRKQITMEKFEGFEYIEGGVCAPQGFKANGLYCGIKDPHAATDGNESPISQTKNDLCLVVSDKMCNTAAVFTQNKVKGAPVTISQKNLAATGGRAQAFILNSKNANTCNADGEQKAYRMCELVAERMNIKPEEVLVAQTGVIGQIFPIKPVERKIDELFAGLAYDRNIEAATAIMTTDTAQWVRAAE